MVDAIPRYSYQNVCNRISALRTRINTRTTEYAISISSNFRSSKRRVIKHVIFQYFIIFGDFYLYEKNSYNHFFPTRSSCRDVSETFVPNFSILSSFLATMASRHKQGIKIWRLLVEIDVCGKTALKKKAFQFLHTTETFLVHKCVDC